MTSRERVLCALRHKEPDKVPIDFGGHRSSGISAIAYARLKKALGITTGDIYVYDMVQQLAIIEPPVLEALGIDVIELGRGFMLDERDWKSWTLPDGTPCKIPVYVNVEKRGDDWYLMTSDGVDLGIQKKGVVFFEQIYWPWAEQNIQEQDFSDLEEAFKYTMWTNVPSPGAHIPLTDKGLRELADGARALRESTDKAIIGLFGGNLFEVPQFLYGMETYLMHMASSPQSCIRLSEALCT
ncbi:MAG: methyltransferase, partial [Candidatus Sumerlaeia bacterium]|nr:methyltransferase [Candidatus Sumerlaeia bacterium]